jgi:hypothetical protein
VIVRRLLRQEGGADSSQHGKQEAVQVRGTEQPPSNQGQAIVATDVPAGVKPDGAVAGGSQQEQQQAPNSGSPQSAPQLPVVDSGTEKPLVIRP